jgi:hypothetical protein
MDITPYVEGLRRDLAEVARAGGPEVAEAAERLAGGLDPALRMVLLEALSHAAAEITGSLGGGSVEVRLKGREPQFVVTPPPAEPDGDAAAAAAGAADEPREDEDDDGQVVRITLRIPESLKQRAEEAAARRGQSLNTWLVNAARMATREGPINIDLDLSAIPFGPGASGRSRRGPGQHVSGWAR